MRFSVPAALAVAAALMTAASPASAGGASLEFLCLKDLKASLEGLPIACYSESGCAYVEAQKAEPLPDYDQESVAYALGREKIEGIVTASEPIMKKIKGFGYSCRKLD